MLWDVPTSILMAVALLATMLFGKGLRTARFGFRDDRSMKRSGDLAKGNDASQLNRAGSNGEDQFSHVLLFAVTSDGLCEKLIERDVVDRGWMAYRIGGQRAGGPNGIRGRMG